MNMAVAVANDRRPGVPTALSDLFFNHDNSGAIVTEKGEFVRFDEDRLTEEANAVLGLLEMLGLSGLPDAVDLVADFLDRC